MDLQPIKDRLRKLSRTVKQDVIDPLLVTDDYRNRVSEEIRTSMNDADSRSINARNRLKIARRELRSETGKQLHDKYLGGDNDPKKMRFEVVVSPEASGNGKQRRECVEIDEAGKAHIIKDPEQIKDERLRRLEQRLGEAPQETPQSEIEVKEIQPSLDLLLRYYEHEGVVGEKNNAILSTFALIMKRYFGVEGPSGSGKSFVVNKAVKLMSDLVYTMELSSNTAESYNADEINRHEIIYIPELQKAMGNKNAIMIELIKNLSEGRDAKRLVRDQDMRQNVLYRITSGKGIAYTLALENIYKKDVELSRRVFQLYTDMSKKHTDEILKSKAKGRFMTEEEKTRITPQELEALKKHALTCIRLDFQNYINPFSEYLDSTIPRENKARSFDDHLFGLMNASAKFHYHERLVSEGNIFLNLQDAYLINELYARQFLLSVLRIPILGEQILEYFSEQQSTSGVTDIYHKLRGENSGITSAVVQDALDDLANVGFLEKRGKTGPYSIGRRSLASESSIDWQASFRDGYEKMKDKFPGLIDDWLKTQLIDDAIKVYNPIKGEYKTIVDI